MVSVILLRFAWSGLFRARVELLPPVGHMLHPDFVSPLDRCDLSGRKIKSKYQGRHKTELTSRKQPGQGAECGENHTSCEAEYRSKTSLFNFAWFCQQRCVTPSTWRWLRGPVWWFLRKTTWPSPASYLRGRGAAASSSSGGSSPLSPVLLPLPPPRPSRSSPPSFSSQSWASRNWSCMGTTPGGSPSQSLAWLRRRKGRCTGCGFSTWAGWTRASTPAGFRRSANTETRGEHPLMAPAPCSWQVGPTKAPSENLSWW